MAEADEPINGANLAFVEALYGRFLDDPHSVSDDWRAYFERLDGHVETRDLRGPTAPVRSIFNPPGGARATTAGEHAAGLEVAARQDRVDQLVRAYRVRGHMIAQLDPLGLSRDIHPELDLAHYDLDERDLDKPFSARTLGGPAVLTLREILDRMRRTYCGYIGVQFMHIDDIHIKSWLQTRMESTKNQLTLTRDQQIRVLTKLTDAENFEQFIHKKFLGAKRFSLEGGESLIPLIDQALEEAGRLGIDEAVIAMAHRGRLNVLANVMGKNPAQIFREFADRDPEMYFGGGDVKYHMGFSSDHITSTGGQIHISLCFNPSHLEFVDPVLIGRVRAKQDRRHDSTRSTVLPLLIHGDAAFAGQGIVQETLNLSELEGYRVGGTIHVIVNNQIGFTTPPESARSSYYATDVAKMLQSPILHVNGENPEAVAQAIRLAMEFRSAFHKDVIIDMYCYRRYGHNEGDDPAFTQPVLYSAIRKRKTVREAYLENLLKLGEITEEEAEEIAVRRRERLEQALNEAKGRDYVYSYDTGRGIWQGYAGGADSEVPEADTRFPLDQLTELLRAQAKVPDSFNAHPKIKRLLATREEMAAGERALDWGAGEALAFGTLLVEGVPVRLSGQDSGRGTFSHRHAVLHDYQNGDKYIPLNNLSPAQARLEPIDSSLSEAAVLGFEYGYSLDMPDGLVLWEAQFGDFANSAQVIIDQFIVSSEDKWRRLSGLVMLLPHGFEGQGPEHSSARLERFLGMCAEDNIQVCNLTTPAQIFHCLRRQMKRKLRKPLVIMTPKSLLRHPDAVSSLTDLAEGRFHRLIVDPTVGDPKQIRRILLCSGKIYYELAQAKEILEAHNVAVHRLEQLYPLDRRELAAQFADYPDDAHAVWVQEEPENMGAWPYIRLTFEQRFLGRFPLQGIARSASASPATGSGASHRLEQELLIEKAFELA
ncbi:MAG: 2-oxoglutarate dehydrogenase E1 component [Myxococcales bacterium]|nr:2-oxoglutarate dehydrogenase E1 component [Myxococcales bacterium]